MYNEKVFTFLIFTLLQHSRSLLSTTSLTVQFSPWCYAFRMSLSTYLNYRPVALFHLALSLFLHNHLHYLRTGCILLAVKLKSSSRSCNEEEKIVMLCHSWRALLLTVHSSVDNPTYSIEASLNRSWFEPKAKKKTRHDTWCLTGHHKRCFKDFEKNDEHHRAI